MRLGKHLLVLLSYLLLTLAYARPLVSRFSTHFLTGDVTSGVWNMWHFRYSLTVLHSNPLWTDFQYWPYGSNLILHHFMLLHDLAAFFLLPIYGTVVTYNLIYVLILVLAGYGTFLMARDWGADDSVAFVAGAAYTFSPATARMMQDIGCLDHLSIHVVPFSLWTFSRAVRSGRLRDSAVAALMLTWLWFSDYYFFLFTLLLMALFFLCLKRPLSIGVRVRAPSPSLKILPRLLEALLLADFLWVAHRLKTGGQQEFHGTGSLKAIASYTGPYLAFWGLAGLRLWARYRVDFAWDREAFRLRSLKPYLAVLGFWTLLNLPMIVAILSFLKSGDLASTQSPWRGGGNPADVFCLLLPGYFHPLWGDWVRSVYAHLRVVDPHISLGLIPLAAAVWLWRRGPKNPWTSLWFACLIFSFLMTLGPWLKVFGVHTYLPLPFYFAHLLPFFSSMQNGFYFAQYAAFFLALLFAAFLTELRPRLTPRLAAWAPSLALALLAVEFVPRDFGTIRYDVPPLLRRLGERPFGALLPIPFGAVFNGLSGHGAMGGACLDMALQPVHRKPVVGGYLMRVSRPLYRTMIGDPFLQALVTAQAGENPPAILEDRARVSRYLREMKISYVLVARNETPASLQRIVARWPLRSIDEEGDWKLYAVQ